MPPLRLFVYGTLMRGRANHALCQDANAVTPAAVWGRLYDLGLGYPTLECPESLILAEAGRDPLGDLRRGRRFGDIAPPRPNGDWDAIPGELMIFEGAVALLARLDAFEDCRPAAPSHYRRALIPILSADGRKATPAWCYLRGALPITGERPRRIPAWP